MTARLSPARRHAMIALLGVISVTGYAATHAPSEAELSHAAVALTVDESSSAIYVVEHDPLPAIAAYSLTGFIGGPEPVLADQGLRKRTAG